MEETGGLHCTWEKLDEHPQCPHGPTLLFGKYSNGQLSQFYACSVCRDRNLCPFYLEHGTTLTKQQKQAWELKKKKLSPNYNHQKLYIDFNELMSESPAKRAYCHKCEKLIVTSEKDKHKDHEILDGLTDYQMNHPTEILKPLGNAKKEAQYFFSKKSTEDIVNMLLKLGAEQVLCIGTPRIHEYIIQNFEHKISSLLLDIDGRFHNFFGPLSYCRYNLFNHHFFNEEAKNVFKDFITQNGGKNMFLVCDPPFGGRVEPMSQTVKTIFDSHKKWNNISHEHELKIIFILPYFMEPTMQKKSNPPGVSGGLKDLKMSDYKVDYDNHPLLASRSKNKKQSSSVRIFTNVPLSLLELSEADGYRYCKKCQKWVALENKHCKKCKECTSKDGRRYRHCDLCERCVKPTWKHCDTCGRCVLEAHVCGQMPKMTGRCLKCNEFGHIEKDCKISDGNDSKTVSVEESKKRKTRNNDVEVFMKKKRKTDVIKKVPKEKKVVQKETKVAKIKKSKSKNSADITTMSGLVKISKGSKTVPSKVCSVKGKVTKKLRKKSPILKVKLQKQK